ncbi:multidrug resistance-associated protein 1-like isoform X2 [Tachypleus tridentatus]|uniref:multidrug resistance-associated protein 1-like isoform X2 n=1 Tax=Tachypleus tridentatus TaxID=6853 RepID=UPI003FD4A0C9
MKNVGFSSKFCISPLWDLQLTWYSERPELTPCFQKSILVWLPCIFLWSFAPVEILRTRSCKGPSLPWTLISISRLLSTFGLFVLTLVDLSLKLQRRRSDRFVPGVELCSSSTKLVTFVLVSCFILRDQRKGRKSSGVLFVFWVLLLLCGAITYVSFLYQVFTEEYEMVKQTDYIVFMAYYPLVVISLVLAAVNDSVPLEINKQLETQAGGFFYQATLLSRVFFIWIEWLVLKGYKTIITLKDLPELAREIRARVAWSVLNSFWIKELKKANLLGKLHIPEHREGKVKKASLTVALVKGFWAPALKGFIFDLINCIFRLSLPLILNLLIDFVSSDEPVWKGFLYAVLLFVIAFLGSVSFSQFAFYVCTAAIQVKAALIAVIYQKALHMSSGSRRKYTVGELVNYMAVDAEKVFNLAIYITLIWGIPLRIVITMILLWQYVGPACLAGVATFFVIFPLSSFLSQKARGVQEKQMILKDSRLKFMNEMLSGIKVLKLYAWETPFMKHILNIRRKEMELIKKFSYLNAGIGFLWNCSPFVLALSTFLTYVLVDERNILDPSTAFVSLTLLNMLRFSLILLPELISNIIQTRVSLKRMNKFLLSEELDTDCVGDLVKYGESITVENGLFSWERDGEPILKNVNLNVKKGQLVAVVGQVGAGKSSLLSALLGEMYKLNGSVNIQGSLAYVPQQAWIQNATIRQNIIMKSAYSSKQYQRLLDACALRTDLTILTGGDFAEIGEKGVNLSGGQKQRISLARAVYQNSDIYLMDDPLSAVDSNVARHIFKYVIGPTGLLKDKTCVLVTNNLSVLPEVDNIIVMKDGLVEDEGSYSDLMNRKGLFAELILQNLNKVQDESLDGPQEKRQTYEYLHEASHESEVLQRSKNFLHDREALSLLLSIDSEELKDEEEELISKQKGAMLIQEEKMEVGKVKASVYFSYLKNMTYPIAFCSILGVVMFQFCEAGANLWLSAWSNDEPLPDGTQNIAVRNWRLTIYGLLGAAQGISVLFSGIFLAFGAVKASRGLHDKMLESTIRAPMSFFDTTPIGRILNRFGKDIDVVDTQIPLSFKGFTDYLFALIGIFAVISMTNPFFIVALIPVGIVYYFIQKLYLAVSRQLKRLESVTRSPIYNNFSETVSGACSIRAYQAQEHFIKISEDRLDINNNYYFMSMTTNRWLAIRLDCLSSIIVLSASLFAVLGRGSISPGIVGLSLSYALNVTEALTLLIRKSAELETRIVSVERIDEYDYLPEEPKWEIPEKKPKQPWPTEGAVKFKNYCTRYREGMNLVLYDINLSIKPEEKVGIVGRTGAGKSSMTLGLFRIIEPAGGSIIIDGVDISQIGLHDLRSILTIIPQDPVLFTGTLRMNLDPSNSYTDEEVWTSLEHAHLKPFVSTLADGLRFVVAEGGDNLRVIVMEYGKIAEVGNPTTLLSSPTSIFYSMAKDANLV